MEPTPTIEQIIEVIREEGIPSFIKSAQRIAELTRDEDADLSQICDIILKDTGMTTRLLRASNSAYNIRRGRTNTVSRAVVQLGVKEVGNICLVSELVDGIIGKDPNTQLVHELVRAFYSAVQARLLAIHSRDRYSEEVFLGALIKRLGRVVFWKLNNGLPKKLSEALEESNEAPQIVEKRVLGFTLDELSELLVEAWELGHMVPSADSDDPNIQRRAKETALSNDLATASIRGWDSEVVAEVVSTISDELGLDSSTVKSLIDRSCKETEDTALSYGLEQAQSAIPELVDEETIKKRQQSLFEAYEPLPADPMVQLECFKKISELMLSDGDIRLILFEIIEGMSRGLGLDRVIFTLVNEERTSLSARLVSAPDQSIIMKKFKFQLGGSSKNFFTQSYIDGKANFFNEPGDSVYQSLITLNFEDLLGRPSFFLFPVIVNDNFIACFYGDRAISKRPLDNDMFNTFCQFATQARLALASKD